MPTKLENDIALARRKAERAAAVAARQAILNAEAAKKNAARIEAKRNQGHTRARHNARVIVPVHDGCVFVLTDQHYDAQSPESEAHKAAMQLAVKLKPYCIVNNGDTIDGASISRWPAGSYSDLGGRPAVLEELTVASKRLGDFERMKFVRWLTWNLGNHDSRFETRLADKVPEYAGVNGFTLKDHFPGWLPAWRTDFVATGEDVPQVIVKHRWKGGQYAAATNTLWAGTSIVTGHLHDLYAKALTDVRGIRWGVSAGTLAPVDSRLFVNYTEDNIQNWQSGFVILHFRDGKFTGPELVYALPDGRVLFRGDVL